MTDKQLDATRGLRAVSTEGPAAPTHGHAPDGGGDIDEVPIDPVLNLLQVASALNIAGAVHVSVEEVCGLVSWIQTLPNPHIMASRDDTSGARYIQLRAPYGAVPVRGTITVTWYSHGTHPLWTSLLDRDDLFPGEERTLTSRHIVILADQLHLVWASAAPRPLRD